MVFNIKNIRKFLGFQEGRLDHPASLDSKITPVVNVGCSVFTFTGNFALASSGTGLISVLTVPVGLKYTFLGIEFDDGTGNFTMDGLYVGGVKVAAKTAANTVNFLNSDLPYLCVRGGLTVQANIAAHTGAGTGTFKALIEVAPDA